MRIAVIGAGVAGLTTAVTLAERGVAVTLHERSEALGRLSASWLAGGMLAPHCEATRADAAIVAPGLAGIDWWAARVPGVERRGTLVVALSRDTGEVSRFARRVEVGRLLSADEVAMLEPDLPGRFVQGLHVAHEAHLDPRRAMQALAERLLSLGGTLRFGSIADPATAAGDAVVDCRGSACDAPGLRRVRGEMLIVQAPSVELTRPVRLLHPRHPIYVVPRGQGRFMIGATEIESAAQGSITVRSILELLGAAYALHAGFGEAEIVETGAGLRPAYPDNLPRVEGNGRSIVFNGLYRHGFLLSPAFAERAADLAMQAAARREIAA